MRLGRLAHRALDLLVAVVADEDDRVALAGELHGLAVDLRHERAGRVDRLQAAALGLGVDGRRDAVGAEDGDRALGDRVVELLDEDRAAVAQLLDDVLVVHDLLAHVDGRAVELERALDRLHGAVDAGAVAARSGEEDLLGCVSHAVHERVYDPPRAATDRLIQSCLMVRQCRLSLVRRELARDAGAGARSRPRWIAWPSGILDAASTLISASGDLPTHGPDRARGGRRAGDALPPRPLTRVARPAAGGPRDRGHRRAPGRGRARRRPAHRGPGTTGAADARRRGSSSSRCSASSPKPARAPPRRPGPATRSAARSSRCSAAACATALCARTSTPSSTASCSARC